jgi:uncharacterized protein (TIGR02265 family)
MTAKLSLTLGIDDHHAMSQETEDVVFGNTVEALFLHALKGRLTRRGYERARDAGIDLEQKLKPFYPREGYYACVRAVAQELFPGQPHDRQMYEMGRAFMDGFHHTPMGHATLEALKVMKPHRALERLTHSFRSSNNYMRTELVDRGPNEVEITLSQTTRAAAYFEAVLERILALGGAKEISLTRTVDDGARCTFVLRWS